VKFGIFYEHQIPRPWTADSEYQQFQNALAQIELADQLGFDYAWQVEHHFLEEYSHGSAPSAFLSAASQRTERIRLGHGVFQLPTNHPIRVAEQAATLDLLSHGRCELGTGEGAGPTELHPFAARVRSKREMWEEGIRALVPCFTEEKVEFHGEFWDWPPRNILPKPLQQPHPPLWVACSNLGTIEMAARRGIGALGFQFATPDGARAWVNRYYNLLTAGVEKLADYQTNPNIAVVSGFMCAPTDEEARAKADGWTFFIFCLEYNAKHDYTPGTVHLWDEYQEWKGTEKAQAAFESGLIGSPETIRKKLREFADTHLDQIILLNQAGKTSHTDICDSLRLFAAEVMPEFQGEHDDHLEWKDLVLSGRLQLEDLSTKEHALPAVAVANPGMLSGGIRGKNLYAISKGNQDATVHISPEPAATDA
jgi:alkanesulfonate monooxygenase SsuD/methylene tetrahydromethanopterin reductase-like flavin-dependent oxidoreductase (luciferase family)